MPRTPKLLPPDGFNMTRQAFNAALKRVAERLPPLEEHHRHTLWCSFNNIEVYAPAPPPQHTHWTREALDLLEPLRLEIEQCRAAHRKGTIERRYNGVTAALPGKHGKVAAGATRPPLIVDVIEAFDTYVKELERIKEEMEGVLREYNHQRFAKIVDQPRPEWIDIIVANERREGHPAGTLHWTQWALPGLKKQLTEVFRQARMAVPKQGRSWTPYPVPNSLKGPMS